MNNLKEYIIEKLHLDNDIDVRKDYSDIEYVMAAPRGIIPEEYLLCKDEEVSGNNNIYVLSFNDINDLCKLSNKFMGFYAYKFNKDYIDSIYDIKNGYKQIKRNDIFVSGTGDTFDNIIKKHK